MPQNLNTVIVARYMELTGKTQEEVAEKFDAYITSEGILRVRNRGEEASAIRTMDAAIAKAEKKMRIEADAAVGISHGTWRSYRGGWVIQVEGGEELTPGSEIRVTRQNGSTSLETVEKKVDEKMLAGGVLARFYEPAEKPRG